MIRAQFELFFIAVGFFSRLPVPGWVEFTPDKLGRAARFLPLVGWLIAAIGAAVFWLAIQVLPVDLAVVLSMAATIRATGAFHEDGWADTCDGFGGGWTKEQVLQIMKDSRIGSYGAIGLSLILFAKYLALANLAAEEDFPLLAALCVAHPLSRLAAVAVMALLDYARLDDSTKAGPVARRPDSGELGFATLCGVLPLLLVPPAAALAVLLLSALVVALAVRRFARRLGGYTGDTLGAVQQVSEIAVYLGILATWSST